MKTPQNTILAIVDNNTGELFCADHNEPRDSEQGTITLEDVRSDPEYYATLQCTICGCVIIERNMVERDAPNPVLPAGHSAEADGARNRKGGA